MDPLVALLSDAALAALEARIDDLVDRRLRELLPVALEEAQQSPWLDAKAAAEYLGVSENAVRLRVRAGVVLARRDGAGRLRFHRDDLDRSMTAEPPRRAKR